MRHRGEVAAVVTLGWQQVTDDLERRRVGGLAQLAGDAIVEDVLDLLRTRMALTLMLPIDDARSFEDQRR